MKRRSTTGLRLGRTRPVSAGHPVPRRERREGNAKGYGRLGNERAKVGSDINARADPEIAKLRNWAIPEMLSGVGVALAFLV